MSDTQTNEERETKEIVTPVRKDKIILKAWLTGGERRNLQKPILNEMKFGKEEELQNEKDEEKKTERGWSDEMKPGDFMEEIENLRIQIVVVSVNGKTEDILDTILNFRDGDYDFVLSEIRKITEDENFQQPSPGQKSGISSEN